MGNIINRMIGYLVTEGETVEGRLKIQITMVTSKLTHKNYNFYSKPIHSCSTRSDIRLVSYFAVRHNYFVLEYTSNNLFRRFTVGGQLISSNKFKQI